MKMLLGIPFSFYNKAWYRQMYNHKGKRCLWYLLLMLAIVWLLFTIRFGLNLNQTTTEVIQNVAKQIPAMTIHAQTLTTDKPGQFKVFYPGSRGVFAVIQTHQPLQNFAEYPAEVWIGPTRALYKSSQQIYAWNYKGFPNQPLNSQNFAKFAAPYQADFIRALVVVFYVLGLVVIFPCSLLLAWVMAPYIKSIAASLQRKPSLARARNLAIAAMTPFWVLLALSYLFKILSPVVFIILLFVLVLYPVYATIACKKLLEKISKENN